MIASQAEIFFVLMVFIRAGGLISMVPFWGGRLIPMQYRVTLAAIFALFVYPTFMGQVEVPVHVLSLIGAGVKELLIGIMMGFAVKMVFFIADFAGILIATEASIMRSEVFDPISESSSTTVSSLLFYLTMLLILTTGTHHHVLEAFIYSYKKVPINGVLPMFFGIESFVKGTSEIFSVGLRMAAPVIAISFVINMCFAVLGKAIPKINVFMLSFSVKILAGISLLLLTLGLISEYLYQFLQKIPRNMLEFIMY